MPSRSLMRWSVRLSPEHAGEENTFGRNMSKVGSEIYTLNRIKCKKISTPDQATQRDVRKRINLYKNWKEDQYEKKRGEVFLVLPKEN